jgi:hypothetical protein
MPCGAAVTITRAALSPERLRQGLTGDIVQAVMTAIAEDRGYRVVARQDAEQIDLLVRRGAWGISVRYVHRTGEVRAAPLGRGADAGDVESSEIAVLVEGISAALAEAADQVFARQVQTALTALGLPIQTDRVQVEYGGQLQPATVFTLTVSGGP